MADFLALLLSITKGACLTGAVILLIRLVFRRILTPKSKYYLWLLLALRLVLPALPESPFSLQNFLPAQAPAPSAQAAEAPAAAIPPAAGVHDPVYWEHDPEAPAMAIPPASETVTETPAGPGAGTVLFYVWLSGASLVLLAYLFLYAVTAQRFRHLPFCSDSDTLRVFLRLKRACGLRREVRLVSGGAGMLGRLFRPTIVIPAERHGEDVAPIVLHELLHLKYGDLWVYLLFQLLTAVYWFNPLVWAAYVLARSDSEAACDQRVLETGLVRPDHYAAILYEEGVLQASRGLIGQTAFGGRRHDLKRRIRGIASFRSPKVYVTVLAVLLALSVTACTLTKASTAEQRHPRTDFDTYIQSYEPPGGVYGLTYEEHLAQGLLDPDQGTLEHHTSDSAPLTYSTFATTTSLGGETVEIVYCFHQTVLSDAEILTQVFVTPPEDVPMGTWLEQLQEPWLDSMTQDTDYNGFQWNTQEYVADFLTDEQLSTVIEAELALGAVSTSQEFPQNEADARHALETTWRVVTAFSQNGVWQFNGTGAALIAAAQAGRTAAPAALPEGMDMDQFIEAIQPDFGHYGWTFQQHLDAGLLRENQGSWEEQSEDCAEFVTTISRNDQTLEASFVFSRTQFTLGTEAPPVLTEIYVTVPSGEADSAAWGLALMEPWKDLMPETLLSPVYCGTAVCVGPYLTEAQRSDAAKSLLSRGAADSLEDAYFQLDQWRIAGGQYFPDRNAWQFNGTGAALYLTRTTQEAGTAPSSSAAPALTASISPYTAEADRISYENAGWGMVPSQVISAQGLTGERWERKYEGKPVLHGTSPISGHPEVTDIYYRFNLISTDLSMQLFRVETHYDPALISYEALVAQRTEELGPPDSSEEAVWTLGDTQLVIYADRDGCTQEWLSIYHEFYQTSWLAEADLDAYLEAVQPPIGHYGWTFQQHVDAGLLDPNQGTLTADTSGTENYHTFTTAVELGGETLNATYVFVETLAGQGSGREVLSEINVDIPDLPMSQWLSRFTGPMDDYMLHQGNSLGTPISVKEVLTDTQCSRIAEAWTDYDPSVTLEDAEASLNGWPLVQCFFDAPRGWVFNGTGAALYTVAQALE